MNRIEYTMQHLFQWKRDYPEQFKSLWEGEDPTDSWRILNNSILDQSLLVGISKNDFRNML